MYDQEKYITYMKQPTKCLIILLGVRMLDGKATDALEASGLSFGKELVDVYVNCWGPKDDGKTFGKPGPLAAKALKQGAELVRNWKNL